MIHCISTVKILESSEDKDGVCTPDFLLFPVSEGRTKVNYKISPHLQNWPNPGINLVREFSHVWC